jgi:hypothetical protein
MTNTAESRAYEYTVLTYGESGGYVEKAMKVSGPFYHGGRARLEFGDELLAGKTTNNWGDEGPVSQFIHFTTRLDVAAEYARSTNGHVYEIDPTGEFRPGYNGDEFKSRHPLTVLRRLGPEEW